MAVCCPSTAHPFGHSEIGRLQAWLPHLETVLRLKRHLLAVGRQDAAIEAALEQLDVGINMVDRAGRVLLANHPVERAMQDERGGTSPNMLRQVQAICACPDGRRHAISRGRCRDTFFAICER